MVVIGTLPKGTKILGWVNLRGTMVLATSEGVYIVANDKLEKLEPKFEAMGA